MKAFFLDWLLPEIKWLLKKEESDRRKTGSLGESNTS
jgi:hypothetical protein